MIFVAPFFLFMGAVFLLPLAFIFYTSVVADAFTLDYYIKAFTGALYLRVAWTTFEISVVSALTTLVLSYPVAYHLSRQPPKRRVLWALFVLLPFYTSILVKSFAFTVILGHNGIVNDILRFMFGPEAGIKMLFNRTGVVIGLTHYLIPFMVFPILASLLAQDPVLHRAAEVMGAKPWRIFWRVTFPLSLPGVIAGTLLCVILSFGMFITPALLGGRKDMMMANLVDFHIKETLNWNMASAVAIVLLLLSSVFILLLAQVRGGQLFGERH
ncbi:MAG: ABC transporter permease [Rhodospirillales bacterium]|jgi:ABC-type spermidine/putrescine transport system permease subunit I|nr:ABC transporter permease [Rhodospirillales bacterium]